MKAMAFGSCMSNLTIAALIASFEFEQTHSIHHNRSDNFIRYYINEDSKMIPKEDMDHLLVYNTSSESQARQFLRNQYADYIGYHDLENKRTTGKTFFDEFKENSIDIILLDNFMDVAARLMTLREDRYSNSPLFLNPGFYQNKAEIESRFSWGKYLEPEESAQNWLQIYRWLRKFQPTAKIFFLPYHHCTSESVPDRYRRIQSFYPALMSATSGENLHIVPPLSPPLHLTKGPEDWPHFQKSVYRALAGYIYIHTIGGI